MSADDTSGSAPGPLPRIVRIITGVAGWPARVRTAPAWRRPRRGVSILVTFGALLVAGSVWHAADRTVGALADLRDERTWSMFDRQQANLVGVDVDGREVTVTVEVAGHATRVAVPHGHDVTVGAVVDVLVAPDGQRVVLADVTRAPAWTSALGAFCADVGALVSVAAWWMLYRRAVAMAAACSWRERLGVWLAGRWAHVAVAAGVLSMAGWVVATVIGSSWAGLASTVTSWGMGVARLATFAAAATMLITGGGWAALWLSAHPSAGSGHVRRAHQVLASTVTPPSGPVTSPVDGPEPTPPPAR